MKKHKIGIILITIFFSFLVLLMWETLEVYSSYLPWALIGAGLLFILVLLLNSNRDSHTKHEKYAPKHFAQIASLTILSVAITIMCAVVLNKKNFSKNFDLTTNHINSLSKESVQFLESIDKDVQIICVPGQSVSEPYCDSTVDLIKLYEKNNPHIINLGTLDLRDTTLLARLQPSGFSRLILITETNKSELTGEISEQKLTNGIINLIKFKKIVYFLSGHGEPTLEASNTAKSYADIVSYLDVKAYESKELNIQNSPIPSDAQVLIVGDNTIPYDSYTENELIGFIKRGGKLILIVNPYRPQGLKNLYTLLNLKADDVLLTLNLNTPIGKQISKQNLLRPPVIMSEFNQDSPITSVVVETYGAQASIPIDGARPFSIITTQNSVWKTDTDILMSAVQSAPIYLTEEQRAKIDIEKPFSLKPAKEFDAEASWPIGFDIKILASDSNDSQNQLEQTTFAPEVVLYGFSLINEYSQSTRVTEELLPLTVAQLYADKEMISIPSRDLAPKQFNLSRNPGAWVLLFAGFLPVCTALIGILIWVKRRTL